MKTSQKQTAPPAAAPVSATQPAPAVAQPEPPASKYPSSLRAQFNRVLYRASIPEQVFLKEFLRACNEEMYNVMEVAYILGNREFGFGLLNEPDHDPKYAKDLMQLYSILMDDEWQASFLRGVCMLAREIETGPTPADVLDFLSNQVDQFQGEVEDARKLLHSHPGVLRDDIREAVRKHPELAA